MIDSNSLVLFLKISELGSFSAVARELKLAKSVVSQRISTLEDQLNIRLLNRTTRKVTLTAEGLQLLPLARSISENIEDIVAFSEDINTEPQGTLRITAPHDLSYPIIRDFVPRFQEKYPNIKLDFQCSSHFVDLIQEQIDVAIRVSAKPLKDSSLVAKRIFVSRIGLYASPEFLKQNPISSITELSKYPKIFLTGFSKIKVRENGKEKPINLGTPDFSCNDMYGCLVAAQAGMGFTLIPHIIAKAYEASNSIVPVLSHLVFESGTAYILYPSRRQLARKTRVFIAELQDFFESLEPLPDEMNP